MGNDTESVRASYDRISAAYADHYANELQHTPLDRGLLSRFAAEVKGRASWANYLGATDVKSREKMTSVPNLSQTGEASQRGRVSLCKSIRLAAGSAGDLLVVGRLKFCEKKGCSW